MRYTFLLPPIFDAATFDSLPVAAVIMPGKLCFTPPRLGTNARCPSVGAVMINGIGYTGQVMGVARWGFGPIELLNPVA